MRPAAVAIFVLLPGLSSANPPTASPGEQCLAAIAAAEQRTRLPTRLLRSIALVESGRLDPVTRRVQPWPWTINAAGTSHVFQSREEAIAAVQVLQAGGVQSIDVGCAQVNLLHHPQAFSTLDAAFDPQTNVDYAARFLGSLQAATGSWPLAAAAYHSQTPERGQAYAQKVKAVWPDADRHGPWPSSGRGGLGPSTDYSIHTAEFAARLRRADADRTRQTTATIYTPEFAARLRQMELPQNGRVRATGTRAIANPGVRPAGLPHPTQLAGRDR